MTKVTTPPVIVRSTIERDLEIIESCLLDNGNCEASNSFARVAEQLRTYRQMVHDLIVERE